MAVSRRNLIALAVVDVVLFLIANVTYPGTVSDVFWGAFVIGVVVLIVLVVAALVRSRRPTR